MIKPQQKYSTKHFEPRKKIPKIEASQIHGPINKIVKKISVIIPTKDGGSFFRDVVKAIEKQIIDIPYEFIVIDSGSSDNTVDIAKNAGAAVIEIDPDDFNHGKTRNSAIMECTGDIIVLMTQDALPADSHLLASLIKPFESEKIAGVYARQTPLPDADPITKRNLLNWITALTYPVINTISDIGKYNRLPPFEKYLLCNFDNVCSAIRKSVWEQIPFSQEYFGEDIVWAKRILELGWSIAYEPSAHVLHSHKRSVAYEFKRTYLCHQKLFELFGLRTVPNKKAVLWSICAQSIIDWKYLISERMSTAEKAKLICKTFPMAIASVSGQYLGANDAYKGITKSFKGV
jgi:glycosyltransferase involved in cell wall biosynthesis